MLRPAQFPVIEGVGNFRVGQEVVVVIVVGHDMVCVVTLCWGLWVNVGVVVVLVLVFLLRGGQERTFREACCAWNFVGVS